MINLGNHSYNYGVQRGTANDVIVGNYTSIAENVRFDGGFNHQNKWITTFPLHNIWHELPSNIDCSGNIVIGSDVWIGEGAIIMANSVIGDGVIIGAGTIIKKNSNIPPYSVVVGAPMKTIKKRFTDIQIKKLLSVQWYCWSDEKVRENAHLLLSENIDEFLDKHYK
jgi:acetyltransferase-like isoleucine patch superfamily enzyme